VRLSELNPEWRAVYKDHHLTPDNGGTPTGEFTLVFRCPTCGPPFAVIVKFGPHPPDQAASRWQANIMPDGPTWPDRITLTPSIDNTRAGHGRKHPTCSFHGSIVNGEIHFS
jgi:hypothetical protein